METLCRNLCFSGLIATLFLTSCAERKPLAQASGEAPTSGFAQPPPGRPGLGTKWGENRPSRVIASQFKRADRAHPTAQVAIYYNEAAGIRAMAGAASWNRGWAVLPPAAHRFIAAGIKDQRGGFLPGLIVGDRYFVVGREGRRYSIVVRNKTDFRLEVVVSVDGLDVVDGRAASVLKRGYLVAPKSELNVQGFRQSAETVAAFRFSPVRESYANQKYHDTRNVGVIGVAVFSESGAKPPLDADAQKRLKANPFPGRFATPPKQ